jgi:hypothetical protein
MHTTRINGTREQMEEERRAAERYAMRNQHRMVLEPSFVKGGVNVSALHVRQLRIQGGSEKRRPGL